MILGGREISMGRVYRSFVDGEKFSWVKKMSLADGAFFL